MTTRLPAEGDVISGKYRIVREIGRGGMSVVYEAHHLELDEVVALKWLLPELADDQGVSLLFAREARAAAKVRSPHVAHVYDVGQSATGLPYIVMERLQGIDLSQLLEERGPLDLPLTLDLMLQLADALERAHARGVVHHDLKPPNLFVSFDQGRTTLKLIDFGISTLTAAGTHPAGDPSQQICGSPEYMAPEQLTQASVTDPRCDIWSLGVILVECLTGRVPFSGATTQDICLAILQNEPDLGELARRGLPASVEQLVRACLRRDVTERIQTVTEWAGRLSSIQAEIALELRTSDAPVVASSPPPFEIDTRRGRAMAALRVAAPGALFILAAFGAGFFAWWWRHSPPGVPPVAQAHVAAQPILEAQPNQHSIAEEKAQVIAPAAPSGASARPSNKSSTASATVSLVRTSAPPSREPRKPRVLLDEELFNEPR